MARPTGTCTTPGCPELKPCPVHKPKGWGAGQSTKLGRSGWERQARNARTMRTHGHVCHWCGNPGADQVDHVIALALGGTDDETNRRPIHAHPCHAEKTLEDRMKAAEARKPHPL